MNCDECQEEIFELIEREAIDPEGVREILRRCPDCAALFEEMKASLKAAAALPIESPPPARDAAILQAAAARKSKVAPPAPRRLQPFPWAVAATALLAVAIGVWAIPRGAEEAEQAELEPAVAPAPADDQEVREDRVGQGFEADADRLTVAEAEESQVAAVEKSAARQPSAHQPRRAAKRAPARRADEELRLEAARAPASPAMAESTAGGAMADVPDASAACAEKEKRLASRKPDANRGVTDAEDALTIGLCYQAAGNDAKAREWLRRASEHPTTKTRALEALQELANE